jgi:quinol---cytochrome c reductase iron-sulfur subunit, bacillus type
VGKADDYKHREPIQHTGAARGRPELEFPGRRSFIVMLVAAGTAFVGALLAVPLVMFATSPLFQKSGGAAWSDAGPTSDFSDLSQPAEPIIRVENRDGWRQVMSEKPVFVMPPKASAHRVFSSICPHLGCQVEWVGGQRHFYCPCHASVFAEDGSVVKGPAPRGLDYLDSKVEQGRLMVKYQYFRLLVPDREIIG